MIVLAKNRVQLTAGGAIAVAIGVAALIWPSISARVVAFLAGAFLLTESVVGFFTRDRSQLHTWSTIVQGVVGLIVALVLVIAPGAALRFVVLLIAAWLLVRGAIHLYLSIKAGDNPGIAMVSVTSGVISAIVGLLLLVRPEAGVIAVSWLVGIFAILTGTFSLLLARRLKPDVEVEAEEVSPESDQ